MKLFLTGDFMSGRGVDQVLPHACVPRIHERVLSSALDYVRLAERANGPVPRPVDYAYVWGDALPVLEDAVPAVRIVNLETSITTSEDVAPKGINYRMHPGNAPVLTVAGVDCCVLANNHVLDWGEAGLLETLRTLATSRVATAGAGLELTAARAPAVLELAGGGRVLVVGVGATDSGIPPAWAATSARAGVNLLPRRLDEAVATIADAVSAIKRRGDVAVVSIHWGGNWGFDIPPAHRRLAHALIDTAGIDLVHGHSSHHAKAIELYRGRLILYGCGDFVHDYEGISGYEEFRNDLVVLYFATLDPTGRLERLEMVPMQMRRFRLSTPSAEDRHWLARTLDRECRRFGCGVSEREGKLVLEAG